MNDMDKRKFSLVARIRSVNHAMRGLRILFKTTHNAWVQIFFAALAVYLGFTLCISNLEWVAIVFAIGLVLVTETLNTALEIDIDLTSPEFHPYARDTKDVAAGAVFLAILCAIAVGAIIFLPKILLFT